MRASNNGQYKWFLLGWGSAQTWCEGLTSGQGIAATTGQLGVGYYYCFYPALVGSVGDVGGYEYKWTETFSIYNSITSETQNLVLSDQSLSGSYVYSPNRQVMIRYSFSGLNVNSYIPDLSSTYSVMYQDAKVHPIERLSPTTMNGYGSRTQVYDTFLRNWLGSTAYQRFIVEGQDSSFISAANNPVYVADAIESKIKLWSAPKTISLSGWTPTFTTPTSASGRVNLARSVGGTPISPVFSIKLDAEWVGVYQPVTKPVIVSFKAEKTSYLEGDYSARFKSEVRNDGTVDGSINYQLTCSPSSSVSISSTPTQTIVKGQTLTQYHNVQANTAGENVKASCCLIVTDRSNPSIKSGPVCGDVTFVEQNQCPTGMVAGSTQCSSTNQIMTCVKNTDGINVLQGSGTFCEYGCATRTQFDAYCMQKPGCNQLYTAGGSCGDKRCDSFEKSGDCACLEDCSTCGDSFCSTTERDGKICPQDCGVDARCGDGVCSQTEFNAGTCDKDCGSDKNGTNWTLIIFGIVALGLIGGAVYFRLKKDGYFK